MGKDIEKGLSYIPKTNIFIGMAGLFVFSSKIVFMMKLVPFIYTKLIMRERIM